MLSVLFFITHAMAQAADAAAPAKPNLLESLIPFAIMFAVIYFLMLRPQAKQKKDHAKFVSELKRGDVVVTAGGIIGKVDNLTDKFITLEVENGAKMKVIRSYILSPIRNDQEQQPKA